MHGEIPGHTSHEQLGGPIILPTDQEGLVLAQMTDLADDQEYLALQLQNATELAEFGNRVYATAEEIAERRQRTRAVCFGIRQAGQLIGAVEYVPSADGREAEVGIVLDASHTGHGIATTALMTLVQHIAPQFDRVFAEVAPSHEKSLRLCERAGFVRQQATVERDWGAAVVLEYPSQPKSSV